MRLGISGSSGYPELGRVRAYLAALDRAEIDYIVTGGCAGMVAYETAKVATQLGIKLESVMSNESVMYDCDRLVSFWDGVSQEAYHVIETTARTQRPVLIIYPDGTEEDVAPIEGGPVRMAATGSARKPRSRSRPREPWEG